MKEQWALFIDIDDTIFDFQACAKPAFLAACKACGWKVDEEAFALFQKWDHELWKEQKEGTLTVEGLFKKRALRFSKLFGEGKEASRFQPAFHRLLSQQTVLVDGVADCLPDLARQYPMYAASNGSLSMQAERLERAGLRNYFQDLFVSDDLGAEKPDRRFFETCLQRSGKTAQKSLMIGDSLTSDICGAKNAGWMTLWFHSESEDREHPKADETLGSWKEIAAFLLTKEDK